MLVVDDGSTDNTHARLVAYQKNFPFTLISYEQNMGKGHAIRHGMTHAQGQYRLFTDLDLSVPLKVTAKMILATQTSGIAIATRKKDGATVLLHQPKLRESLGKVFTQLSKMVLGVNVSDFTCGFKCFSKDASKNIFSRAVINRWGFDSEIMFIAAQLGVNVAEVPVEWKNDPRTKVKFPQDIIRSFDELIQIRWNGWQGKYAKQYEK